VEAATGLRGCPFCSTELGSGATSCGSCGAALVTRTYDDDRERSTVGLAPRLAITRRAGGDESLLVWRDGEARADDPGLTFDPIKVGADTCSGCESTAVFVVDGQAAVYSLEGCDDDWCFYENPQGIA